MENIKQMNKENVIIELPIEDTFDCPVGSFTATLDQVKFKRELGVDESAQQVRLLFAVDVPQIKHKRVLTGRNFHPQSKQLRNFLESWFGRGFYSDMKD